MDSTKTTQPDGYRAWNGSAWVMSFENAVILARKVREERTYAASLREADRWSKYAKREAERRARYRELALRVEADRILGAVS